jgi:RimJ/RimL family protein N-acetyltransferase
MQETPFYKHTIHLLGYIVFGDYKGRGIGGAILSWVLEHFGKTAITAAVNPHNPVSEHALASRGFRVAEHIDGEEWKVWIWHPSSSPKT